MWVKLGGKLKRVISCFTKNNTEINRIFQLYEKGEAWQIKWEEIKVGTIVMFEGSIEDIPYGWAFCDGTNGTPDLRDRFIIGTTNGSEVGTTGGSATHTHNLSDSGSHSHSLNQGGSHTHPSGYVSTGVGATAYGSSTFDYRGTADDKTLHTHGTSNSTTHNHGGLEVGDNALNHYTLAFIIKK